jgi:hypothetical protein
MGPVDKKKFKLISGTDLKKKKGGVSGFHSTAVSPLNRSEFVNSHCGAGGAPGEFGKKIG